MNKCEWVVQSTQNEFMNSCCVPNVIYFSSLILLFSYSFGFHWTPRSHSAKFISFTLNEDVCILCFASVVHNTYRGVCKSSFTMPFEYACVCECERVRSDVEWSGVEWSWVVGECEYFNWVCCYFSKFHFRDWMILVSSCTPLSFAHSHPLSCFATTYAYIRNRRSVRSKWRQRRYGCCCKCIHLFTQRPNLTRRNDEKRIRIRLKFTRIHFNKQ